MPSRIEDYALIGDCETAAIVSKGGCVDWLCWPRFDSGACFSSLLGDANHGHWLIAPAAAGTDIEIDRPYANNTLILETRFTSADPGRQVIRKDGRGFTVTDAGQKTLGNGGKK
jgi:GH15 family glucan-1,4-alpha-glucosidase